LKKKVTVMDQKNMPPVPVPQEKAFDHALFGLRSLQGVFRHY
jgi:hypothetical protein